MEETPRGVRSSAGVMARGARLERPRTLRGLKRPEFVCVRTVPCLRMWVRGGRLGVGAVTGRDRCARKRSRRCMQDAGLDRVCGDRAATCATAAGAIGAPARGRSRLRARVPYGPAGLAGAREGAAVARARACHGDVVRV